MTDLFVCFIKSILLFITVYVFAFVFGLIVSVAVIDPYKHGPNGSWACYDGWKRSDYIFPVTPTACKFNRWFKEPINND